MHIYVYIYIQIYIICLYICIHKYFVLHHCLPFITNKHVRTYRSYSYVCTFAWVYECTILVMFAKFFKIFSAYRKRGVRVHTYAHT